MKIAFHHLGILPVKKYGGIERMLFWHMCELVKQGHQVVLFGHPESEVTAHGIELIHISDSPWWEQLPKDVDVIQLYYNFQPPVDIPTIINVGCNGQPGEEFHINSVFVSENHANDHGSDVFVYNAIDFSEYPFEEKKKENNWENFLFLAKASWRVKNLKHCSKAARNAKKHLHIVGGKSYWPSKYLHNNGMLGGEEKLAVIRSCDALLFPVRWPEPFGIAIIEAMSQGLPVIGSPYGSLPELITEETGIICNNYEELLKNLMNPKREFEPSKIRAYVEEKFNIPTFTAKYVELYKRVINGETLNKSKPTLKSKVRAESLLPF